MNLDRLLKLARKATPLDTKGLSGSLTIYPGPTLEYIAAVSPDVVLELIEMAKKAENQRLFEHLEATRQATERMKAEARLREAERERDELRAYVKRLETTVEEFDEDASDIGPVPGSGIADPRGSGRAWDETTKHVAKMEARLRAADQRIEKLERVVQAARKGLELLEYGEALFQLRSSLRTPDEEEGR